MRYQMMVEVDGFDERMTEDQTDLMERNVREMLTHGHNVFGVLFKRTTVRVSGCKPLAEGGSR